MEKYLHSYLDKNCDLLSEKDIISLEKSDNGSINNVIEKIENHCFGISFPESDLSHYHLYYVNNSSELSGIICRIELKHKRRNEIVLAFSKIVSDKYKEDTDFFECFNTFQFSLKTLLEKNNVFTVGSDLHDAGLSNGTFFLKT